MYEALPMYVSQEHLKARTRDAKKVVKQPRSNAYLTCNTCDASYREAITP